MLILLIFIWEGKYWNTTFITQFRLFAVSVFKWEGLILYLTQPTSQDRPGPTATRMYELPKVQS